MANTNYYDKFIPEAMMRELKNRVEGRLYDELLPLAQKIISEEICNAAINLTEWVSANNMGTNVSIVIQNPRPNLADDKKHHD